ncbi:hypothetical protein RRG08_061918 [Elysia crispata]|uniref:Uncharacterized protein n=1 Tax=Elysia crispata TaxID=231223 RepID=A0AAE1E5P2_9GAST|nr:hypothetical protein RRG08_061918 [Elysia crispata]
MILADESEHQRMVSTCPQTWPVRIVSLIASESQVYRLSRAIGRYILSGMDLSPDLASSDC